MKETGKTTDGSVLSIDGLPDAEALDRIGLLIDAAHDARSASGTDRAFELLEQFRERNPTAELAITAHYFSANAWANRRRELTGVDPWSWEQPEQQEQILALRNAVSHKAFGQLERIRQCQILTNLANELDTIGRFIEAVELWDRALAADPRFAMARGNRGRGLSGYAAALYDPGHQALMRVAAHDGLQSASARDALWDHPASIQSAGPLFERERKKIADFMDVSAVRQQNNQRRHSLGRSAAEKRYRTWCLHHRLFINPLNDLGTLPIACHDVLTLPTITESTSNIGPPFIIGFFNQMKQEFVSARHLYYEGVHAKGVHYSDKGVLLYNTLDYPAYSLGTEKVRASFRLAYSLLDKIAYFLNDYFTLGHSLRQVSFRSVWYEPRGTKSLLVRFSSSNNWPLRGLFWISKDLFEEGFQRVTEPDAAALSEIRNHLEHKYLQLHEMMDSASGGLEPGTLRYKLSTFDFDAKTLRLLKLARAALIHLSLAVYSEERRRESEAPENTLSISIPLDKWKDEWKQ